MELHEMTFKRRFSVNFHGNLKLKTGEMSFHKDYINDRRGDPYPLIGGTHYGCGSEGFGGSVKESVRNGTYTVSAEPGSLSKDENGAPLPPSEHHGKQRAKRLMGGFFPWYTYELDFSSLFLGSLGIAVDSCEGSIEILLSSKGFLEINAEGNHYEFEASIPPKAANMRTLTVAFRSGGVTVYNGKGGDGLCKICDLTLPTLERLRLEKSLATAHAYLLTEIECGGEIVLNRAEWFLSAGLSQADLRPVKYENGEIYLHDGRVYLTASARQEVGGYQVVLSFNPSTCDFRYEGAMLFDCGDGFLCGDVASSVVYNRESGTWLIWMCMFSHGHFLGRAETSNCPLYGINYIDVTPMKKAQDGDSLTAFKGFRGDEDPDLIRIGDKWHLAVCRIDGGKYKYYHFISDSPLDGFEYVDHTPGGEKTGGSFVRCHDGKVRFTCGSDFSKRAVYDVYPVEDFTVCEHLKCDFDDGGFRGWGSVMLLPIGTRQRYTWITFDRHNATAYNWSYGNIYVFDSESFR
ncbi:MAG: hypothetical protein IJY39_11375 [Clostridia bacterium]|nr:hypothetical protein [Clostridia bacterium]